MSGSGLKGEIFVIMTLIIFNIYTLIKIIIRTFVKYFNVAEEPELLSRVDHSLFLPSPVEACVSRMRAYAQLNVLDVYIVPHLLNSPVPYGGSFIVPPLSLCALLVNSSS